MLTLLYTLTLSALCLAAAPQVVIGAGCDASDSAPSSTVFSKLGGTPGKTSAAVLGLGTITYGCSSAGKWVETGEKGTFYDMSCLAVDEPASRSFQRVALRLSLAPEFDALPPKALPIFVKYQTSSGAVKAKLSGLTSCATTQLGSFTSAGRTATFDLSKGYGAGAKLTAPLTGARSATPAIKSGAWIRYVLSSDTGFADTVYRAHTAGAPASGSCRAGQTKSVPFAAQYCETDSLIPSGQSQNSKQSPKSLERHRPHRVPSRLRLRLRKMLARSLPQAATKASARRTSRRRRRRSSRCPGLRRHLTRRPSRSLWTRRRALRRSSRP
jgi:hypothetical protein